MLAMVEREDEMGERAVFSWVPSPDFWLLAWIFMGKFRGNLRITPKVAGSDIAIIFWWNGRNFNSSQFDSRFGYRIGFNSVFGPSIPNSV